MAVILRIIFILSIIYLYSICDDSIIKTYLEHLNEREIKRLREKARTKWFLTTNINARSEKIWLTSLEKIVKEKKEDFEEIQKIPWQKIHDPFLQRQWKLFGTLEFEILPEEEYIRFLGAVIPLEMEFSTTKITEYYKKPVNFSLDEEIATILAYSSDPEEMSYIWTEWRRVTGRTAVRKTYETYVKLMGRTARINKFKDVSSMWLGVYDYPKMKEAVNKMWLRIRPLYLQLHAYVRFKLKEKYGDIVSSDGPIPAHLLGNMYAENWENTIEYTRPYEIEYCSKTEDEYFEKKITIHEMYRLVEGMFTSMNMSKLSDTFWHNSILEKPQDIGKSDVICHKEAFNFFEESDFRIRDCAVLGFKDFLNAHRLIAQIYYFMAYKYQPAILQEAPNAAFKEGITSVFVLAAQNLEYLFKISVYKGKVRQLHENMNMLFQTALYYIPMLPYAYIVDLWRWEVFAGHIKEPNWNCAWWKYRNDIQGIEPPADRTESEFDPAAKYHIFRGLCIESGEYDPQNIIKPLYLCNLANNKDVGDAILDILRMGRSRHWTDALFVLTGQREFDPSAILEYFSPLMQFLDIKNKNSSTTIGWNEPTKKCRSTRQKE